ncbi:MAG: STAS domain-containing protein [Hyphomicrobium aestuarii]|nr:STAS domain-containing protein [Hyphomicrobium aestuarii]
MSVINAVAAIPPVEIALPAILDMRHAHALKVSLDGITTRAAEIDGSNVARLSTGCIQVLVAFLHMRSGAGSPVTIRHPSPAFLQAFDDLGLDTDGNTREPA